MTQGSQSGGFAASSSAKQESLTVNSERKN
jgi:hypothetical protein